jgi:predicted permease
LALGREFSSADTETSPKVAIVSESVARKFFPDQNPMGRRLGFMKPEAGGDFQIVGVAKDILPKMREPQSSQAVYIPYTQAFPDDYGQMTFLIHSALDPSSLIPAVRRAVESIDKNLPAVDVQTEEADAADELGDERSLATLLSFFGALALLLAAIGLYGTMSYSVVRRTKELGIRMTLGARKEVMLWMILRETIRLVAVGVAIGIPLSLASAPLISSWLFGVKPADPVTILISSAVMLMVALLASYLPARRATKVDPMVALRYE